MKTLSAGETVATSAGTARRSGRGLALAAPGQGMPVAVQRRARGGVGAVFGQAAKPVQSRREAGPVDGPSRPDLESVSPTALLDPVGALPAPAAPPANAPGLPARLKSGVEALSGVSMNDVRVHYNSQRPSQLQALAYTRGADIHVAPGQERHLPHEAWHVVQQKQGRVNPTLRIKGVAINDNAGLEVEADAMGVRANQFPASVLQHDPRTPSQATVVRGARMASAGPIFQRKIKFKNRAVWAAEKDIPKELHSAARIEQIESQVRSDKSYLAQKPADMERRAREQKAPLLTPHRHLIGEIHTESRFEDALSDWGWGADKVVEHFQESTHVVDKLTEENRTFRRLGFFTNPYFGARPLENLHPKTLTHLSELRAWLDELQKWSRVSSRHAANIASGTDVEGNKSQFNELERQTDAKRKRVAELWKDLSLYARSYEAACADKTSGKPEALARLCTAMKDQWKAIPDRIKLIAERPYSAWSSWKETKDGLGGVETAIQRFFDEIINPWAEALVELTIDEVKDTLPDADLTAEDIREAWEIARATSGPEAIAALGPVRELFMADKINKADQPALVQVGEGHLKGLQQRGITDGKFHPSYDDFVADTMSLDESLTVPSTATDEEKLVQLASNGTAPVVQRAVIIDQSFGENALLMGAYDRIVSVIKGEPLLAELYEHAANDQSDMIFAVKNLAGIGVGLTELLLGDTKLNDKQALEELVSRNPEALATGKFTTRITIDFNQISQLARGSEDEFPQPTDVLQILTHEYGLHATKNLPFLKKLRELKPDEQPGYVAKAFEIGGSLSGGTHHQAQADAKDEAYNRLSELLQKNLQSEERKNFLESETNDRKMQQRILDLLSPEIEKSSQSVERTALLQSPSFAFNKRAFGEKPAPAEKSNERCFITTACVTARGLPDDCEELTVLRAFRDDILCRFEQGKALCADYYRISPGIVAAIADTGRAEQIYARLYGVIRFCVDAVQRGDYHAAFCSYVGMVLLLLRRRGDFLAVLGGY